MTTPRVTVPEAIEALKHCVENEKAHWSLTEICDPCVDVPVKYLRAAIEALSAAPAPGGAVLQAFADEVARIAVTEDTSGDDAFNALNVVVDYARELSKARPAPDDTSGDLHGHLFRNPALATREEAPAEAVDSFECDGCDGDRCVYVGSLCNPNLRARPQARPGEGQ